eukprot:scaffold205622_cov31-Tisochrysis_lutea.AAC.2
MGGDSAGTKETAGFSTPSSSDRSAPAPNLRPVAPDHSRTKRSSCTLIPVLRLRLSATTPGSVSFVGGARATERQRVSRLSLSQHRLRASKVAISSLAGCL